MSHLHKLKEIQVTLKASQDTIDAIAGVAKNTLDAQAESRFNRKSLTVSPIIAVPFLCVKMPLRVSL